MKHAFENIKPIVPRETSPCKICGYAETSLVFTVKDHHHTNEEFSILECAKCKVLFTNPIPPNLDSYYDNENYISHNNAAKGFIPALYRKAQLINIALKYRIARNVSMGTNWADYGCGSGIFAHYVKSKGLEITGFEPSSYARNLCLNKEIRVYHSDHMTDQSTQYDIITLWHVLEHISDIHTVLQTFHNKLHEKGKLVIALPNHSSLDARLYKQNWAAWDVPRHLWHFNESSIIRLMAKHHFIHVKTKGLPFDAFYISMLSEKYSGKTPLRGLAAGFLSNFTALFTQKYSSNVYIFEKGP